MIPKLLFQQGKRRTERLLNHCVATVIRPCRHPTDSPIRLARPEAAAAKRLIRLSCRIHGQRSPGTWTKVKVKNVKSPPPSRLGFWRS